MDVQVSIVVPARDEAPIIGECLEALSRQTIGATALEVVVVAAGEDDTAGAASRVGAALPFGRFEVLRLEAGNKNVALRHGCARTHAPIIVLLDADTIVEPDAIAVLARALGEGPERAVHGAALPRHDTWVSRYWELNRRLVKDLRFDGDLSGELIAMRRATLAARELHLLFPETLGAKCDLYLGRALEAGGCTIAYAPEARARTMTPWTLRGLAQTMLRSRRGRMATLALGPASLQAGLSALVVGSAPVAIVASRWLHGFAVILLAPLAGYAAWTVMRVAALHERGLVRRVPAFLLCDLLGRACKVAAYTERIIGRSPPLTFRGQRA